MTRLQHRLWNSNRKRWLSLTSNYGTTVWINSELCGTQEYMELDRWTGCVDTNKNYIYENDIVSASIYTGELALLLNVYFEKGAFWINYPDGDTDRYVIGEFPGSLAIIGNTRENPEIQLD